MKIGFIGAGNMANAMINSLINTKLYHHNDINIYDPELKKSQELGLKYQINVSSSNKELTIDSDIIILAVKPYSIKAVASEILEHIDQHKIIISIAAGITLDILQSVFNSNTKLVRVMPNAATLVNEGISAICYNHYLLSTNIENVKEIFRSFGEVVELDESKFDVFTSICASSPAFVFLFITALAESGVQHGMDQKETIHMVAQAVLGAAKIMLESNENPNELIDRVCTKGGTTIEGMKVLQNNDFFKTIVDAANKTTDRAKELSIE